MNPIQHPEMVRVVHEQMIRDELRRRRPAREGISLRAFTAIRAATARFLVALGSRIDPAPQSAEPSMPGKRGRVVSFYRGDHLVRIPLPEPSGPPTRPAA